MAEVQAPSGLSVSPSAAPAPLQQVNPPAEAFAGNVLGEGAQNVGAGARKAGDQLAQFAETFQAINNKTAADAATVGAAQHIDQLGADYRANNQGMQAFTNLPDFYKQVEEARNQFGSNLSPLAKVEFEAASRRMALGTLSATSNYAAEQRRGAINKTADATINMAGQAYVTEPTPENEAFFHKTLGEQAAIVFSPTGEAPDGAQVRQFMVDKAGPIYAAQVKQLYDGGDLAGANAALAEHKDMMSPQVYAGVAGALRTANAANSRADEAYAAVTGGTIAPQSAQSYVDAVHGREGVGDNPYSSASGIGQFTQGTWLGLLKGDPQFKGDIAGKSDAQILAMRNNPAVADRAIGAYGVQNSAALQAAGITPTNASVGLAHGYGPGAAERIINAPANTPMSSIIGEQVAANNRVGGMTTGQVVAQFNQRFGTDAFSGSTGAVQLAAPPQLTSSSDLAEWKASALTTLNANAMALHPNDAGLREDVIAKGMTYINRMAAPFEAQQNAAYNTILSGIQQQNIQDPTSVQQAFPNEWNQVSPTQRRSLMAGAATQGRFLTPDQQVTVQNLNGQMALARGGLLDPTTIDVKGAGLPPQLTTSLLKEQDALASKPGAASDKTVAQIMSSQEGKSAIDHLGLGVTQQGKHSAAYYNFAGVLQAQVEEYRTNSGGKNPDTKTQAQMIAKATATVGAKQGVFGTSLFANPGSPAFQVPADESSKIEAQLIQRNLPHTPRDIGYWYAQRLRSEGKL